jgi:hypothetical protein
LFASVAVVAIAWASPADAAIILDGAVIRVYDNAGVPTTVRAAMLRHAAEILGRGDLGVAWLVCPSRRLSTLAKSCDRPPGPSEFVVRLTMSPRRGSTDGQQALGFSVMDATDGNGLSTVYVDRVDWLAAQARADRGTVLGRALAHELSHLLLGSNDHTTAGLLRETWTAEELVRNRPEDWQLTPAQRLSARARLAKASVSRTASRTAKSGKGGVGG